MTVTRRIVLVATVAAVLTIGLNAPGSAQAPGIAVATGSNGWTMQTDLRPEGLRFRGFNASGQFVFVTNAGPGASSDFAFDFCQSAEAWEPVWYAAANP